MHLTTFLIDISNQMIEMQSAKYILTSSKILYEILLEIILVKWKLKPVCQKED